MLRICLAACALVLVGCPKNVENVSGSDDEQMDRYSAQLEELRARATQDMQCDDWCSLKSKACSTSSRVCDIAAGKSERADFQAKCVAAQEDCARYSDSCSNCKK